MGAVWAGRHDGKGGQGRGGHLLLLYIFLVFAM